MLSIKMLDTIACNDILENQRDHFIILNENMVDIAMNVDGLSTNLYGQRCPMVNNNSSALWLNKEENVRNPYYREAMLTCGSVIDKIK